MIKGDTLVIGVGARSATGLDALTCAMSLRARKAFVRESRFVDRAGEPIALATVSSVGEDLTGRDRFVALAAPALAEAARAWTSPLPLVLAVPPDADPLDPRGARLLAALGQRANVALDLARSRIVAQGRAGGVAAIEAAMQRLARNEDEAILVGGVDSWFDADRLEALDKECRLHGSKTENGFIPGEGAAFVLLASRSRAGARARFGSILAAASEREPRPFGSAEPCHALGMTLAMKRALAPLGPTRIGWALTDVVGERHRVEEWLFASGRVQSSFTEDLRHDTPLVTMGDLGAAASLFCTVVACIGWQTGSAPAPAAVVAAHSDGPERGALLVASEAS